MRKGHMENDSLHHAVLCLTGLTVKMSTKSTVTNAKPKRKENLINQRIPRNRENEKRA